MKPASPDLRQALILGAVTAMSVGGYDLLNPKASAGQPGNRHERRARKSRRK